MKPSATEYTPISAGRSTHSPDTLYSIILARHLRLVSWHHDVPPLPPLRRRADLDLQPALPTDAKGASVLLVVVHDLDVLAEQQLVVELLFDIHSGSQREGAPGIKIIVTPMFAVVVWRSITRSAASSILWPESGVDFPRALGLHCGRWRVEF